MESVAELNAYFATTSRCPSCDRVLPRGQSCTRCISCPIHGWHKELHCTSCAKFRADVAETVNAVKDVILWVILIQWFAAFIVGVLTAYLSFEVIRYLVCAWLYAGGAHTEAWILGTAIALGLGGGAIAFWFVGWLTKR